MQKYMLHCTSGTKSRMQKYMLHCTNGTKSRNASHISKELKISFCHQLRLSHYKSVNLFRTYTIWLFTCFAQINVGNNRKLYAKKYTCWWWYLTFHSWQKNKMNSISKQAYGNLYWVFLSHWYNLLNNLHYYVNLAFN